MIVELATSGADGRPAPPLPHGGPVGAEVDLEASRQAGTDQLLGQLVRAVQAGGPGASALRASSTATEANLVGVDWNDRPENARAFITQSDWRYSVLRDSSGDVGNAYGLNGLPTTFVLDPSGDIVQKLQGPQTASSLSQALASAG